MSIKDEAVEAAKRIRDTAMQQTLAARIPESGHFGAIAQDADWLVDHLSTALPHMGGVSVKPLEWEPVHGEGVETYQATCATGIYRVFEDEDSAAGAVFAEFAIDVSRFCMTDALSIGRFHNFDVAKAAAQADYERRILSALASHEPTSEAQRGVENAEKRIAEIPPGTLLDDLPDEVLFGDHSYENPTVRQPAPEPAKQARVSHFDSPTVAEVVEKAKRGEIADNPPKTGRGPQELSEFLSSSEPAKDGPEVVGWRQTDGDVVSAADMILPDKLDEPLVRLSDYEALRAERDAALEAEDEAKDCFWAIYPDWVEMKGHGINVEAARTMLADQIAALRAENERLRRLDAEYGRVETAIIMADPAFDGDSPHDNCGDRLIASVHRLRDLAALNTKGGEDHGK